MHSTRRRTSIQIAARQLGNAAAMKKTTILAVSLVLAAAIVAVWFGRERPDSEQISSPVAPSVDVVEPAPRVVTSEANDRELETPQSESSQSGPVRLFSPVDAFDDEYRSASQQAGIILASITSPPILRSQILLTDQGLVSEFVRQVTSGELRQAFNVSPFADDPCTVSTVDRTSPRFTPESVPNVFEVFLDCDSSDKEASAWVNMSERSVTFFMKYGVTSYTVRPIGDSKYSLAYQAHYEIPASSRPGSFSIPRNSE